MQDPASAKEQLRHANSSCYLSAASVLIRNVLATVVSGCYVG
jgi:hypothetical protein